MKKPRNAVAFGGIFAALALVLMCMGTLIPFATYACPVLCMLLLLIVKITCGTRTAWTWYIAVALLAMLLGPDKEAALLFVLLGYYPIVKPWFDRAFLGVLWKTLLFNVLMILMYGVLARVFGIEDVADLQQPAGVVILIITLLLGNLTFFLLDRLLTILPRRFR